MDSTLFPVDKNFPQPRGRATAMRAWTTSMGPEDFMGRVYGIRGFRGMLSDFPADLLAQQDNGDVICRRTRTRLADTRSVVRTGGDTKEAAQGAAVTGSKIAMLIKESKLGVLRLYEIAQLPLGQCLRTIESRRERDQVFAGIERPVALMSEGADEVVTCLRIRLHPTGGILVEVEPAFVAAYMP